MLNAQCVLKALKYDTVMTELVEKRAAVTVVCTTLCF